MAAQETGWPLLDFYSAWLRWVQAMIPNFPAGSGDSGRGVAFAPEALSQPINPGWVFGNVSITNRNSGDPELERRILEAVSYGRQLGRVMDALAVLVARADSKGLTSERRDVTPDRKEAFDDFWEVMIQIADAKSAAASRWLSEEGMTDLADNLMKLRRSDREKYERLAAILRSALGG